MSRKAGSTRVVVNSRDDLLPVACWCQEDIVHVRAADIGTVTASCGRRRCVPPGTPIPPIPVDNRVRDYQRAYRARKRRAGALPEPPK